MTVGATSESVPVLVPSLPTASIAILRIRKRNAPELRWHGEKRLLEMVASGVSLPGVFAYLCSFVELQLGPGCRCGVYLVDWQGPSLQVAAAPNLPSAFSDGLCELPMYSEGCPSRRAACRKMQQVVVDIESDSFWRGSPFRSLALAHGKRSCWSTPIMTVDEHVFGAVAIFEEAPRHPTPSQLEWVRDLAAISAIALDRAQRELTVGRRQALLAEGQRLSATGSFSWRMSTGTLECSEQLYRILDFDQGVRLTASMMVSRVHPEDRPAIWGFFERARSGDREVELEHRLLLPDDTVKYVHLLARRSEAEDGEIEYTGALWDVTQRRIAEQERDGARSELVHIARSLSLGALTASIAHEVSQPLSGIVTNAGACLRLLGGDRPNVPAALETARRIIRDGSRASEVIARLRALFGRKQVETEVFDLNAAARDVLDLLTNELQRNRVVVRVELAMGLAPVTGDRIQLQQVIMNLVLNASDAMRNVNDRPRRLVVETGQGEGRRICLSVTDVGVGLDEKIAKQLYQPFRSTKERGMGIGLFVSRFIVQRHGGDLTVVPNESHGVRFSFSVPESHSDRTPTNSVEGGEGELHQ